MLTVIGTAFLLPWLVYAQPTMFQVGPWNQLTLRTTLGIDGDYRTQERVLKSGATERPKTSILTGYVKVRSKSYVVHPNLLVLDIDFGYQPASRRYRYVVLPDRTEALTAKKFDVRATVFSQRPLSFSLYRYSAHVFNRRELITDVEVRKKSVGASVRFTGKILPLSVRFSKERWDQLEIETNRHFFDRRKTLTAQANRSFWGRDANRVRYTYTDYTRSYAGLYSIQNAIDELNISNRFDLNSSRTSTFVSNVLFYRQKGVFDFRRMQANENLTLALPARFAARADYQRVTYDRPDYRMTVDQSQFALEHRLYMSLRTRVYYRFTKSKQPGVDDRRKLLGFMADYRKRIPGGILSLNYELRRQWQSHASIPGRLVVVDEAHELWDDRTVLLDNPYVDLSTIRVTDESGTIVYQENLDYILVEQGVFVEIRRLPGSQIPNGGVVYVDYVAEQERSYSFRAWNRKVGGALSLFRRAVELYYNYYDQDYDRVSNPNVVSLNYLVERMYGGRLQFWGLRLGYEKHRYESSIIPYRYEQYEAGILLGTSARVGLFLSARYRDYFLLRDQERQRYFSTNAQLSYRITRVLKFNLEGGYRSNRGRSIDLDLTNVRTELATAFRRLTFVVGFQVYRRNFLGEQINYNGAYFRLARHFE
ncbi:MAG: hypothetical protein GXO73_13390 [Calditrichaeota bacterium]|nr:hypothetical protein [Calditrichota bacterium]